MRTSEDMFSEVLPEKEGTSCLFDHLVLSLLWASLAHCVKVTSLLLTTVPYQGFSSVELNEVVMLC